MNPGRSAETMTCLPSSADSSRIAASVVVARGGAADQLDERHDGHRAEEVHAHEAGTARLGDRGSEAVDRDRARVRGEDRRGGRLGVETPPEVRLDVEVLEDRLDDEIGAGRPRTGRPSPGHDPGSRPARPVRACPSATARSRLAAIRSRPASARPRSGSIQRRRACRSPRGPGAMPWPIRPAPATKTRSIGIGRSLRGRRHEPLPRCNRRPPNSRTLPEQGRDGRDEERRPVAGRLGRAGRALPATARRPRRRTAPPSRRPRHAHRAATPRRPARGSRAS